jgi:hypothetical protein
MSDPLGAAQRAADARNAAGGPRRGATSNLTADWPAAAADTVDLVVNTIHDKAIRPIVVAARAVVFGLIIATLVALVITVLSVGTLRLLDVYVFPGRVWASYAVLAAIFCAGGVAAWSRRSVPEDRSGEKA